MLEPEELKETHEEMLKQSRLDAITDYDEKDVLEHLLDQEPFPEDDDKFDTSDISDGYHTFGELYHHRAVLFAVIVNNNLGLSFKSKLHDDGTMFSGMFIVGIKTPEGWYSYHYDMSEWDIFKCKEWSRAPKYDGHKPEDVERLLSLTSTPHNKMLAQSTLNNSLNNTLPLARNENQVLYSTIDISHNSISTDEIARSIAKSIKEGRNSLRGM